MLQLILLTSLLCPVAALALGREDVDILCPLGQFPCGNMSECLPQALHCNGHKDCPNSHCVTFLGTCLSQ
uniref:Uncharacterized protein n=1 Tax=Periophthalmus magnuspinnatus TaxID=409849 RepID=A0A3B3Z8Y2_9GOBI